MFKLIFLSSSNFANTKKQSCKPDFAREFKKFKKDINIKIRSIISIDASDLRQLTSSHVASNYEMKRLPINEGQITLRQRNSERRHVCNASPLSRRFQTKPTTDAWETSSTRINPPQLLPKLLLRLNSHNSLQDALAHQNSRTLDRSFLLQGCPIISHEIEKRKIWQTGYRTKSGENHIILKFSFPLDFHAHVTFSLLCSCLNTACIKLKKRQLQEYKF